MACTEPTTAQQLLLQTVQDQIATSACKRWSYSRVGRETQFLIDDIMALRNIEFLLCGRELDCDVIECLSCKVNRLK